MMQNYSELVEALMYCTNEDNVCTQEQNCGYYGKGFFCQDTLMNDAAAAIEALQAEVDTLKRTDYKRCQECLYLGQPVDEQLLPKRGEWVGVSPTVDTVQCSVCGGQLFSAELETPYCPYCGAKMEVQE